MRISVKVKLRAKEERVKEAGPGRYEVWVKEPPIEGRANDAVIRLLARHLGVPKSRVRIASGHTGRNKVLEIR